MPSSHLRVEEATSIIACKSLTNGFGRSEIKDEMDDFVLEIDENEINSEIKANPVVGDPAIDVLKPKNGLRGDKGDESQGNVSLTSALSELKPGNSLENKQPLEKNNDQIEEPKTLEEGTKDGSEVNSSLDGVESKSKEDDEQIFSEEKKIKSFIKDTIEQSGVVNTPSGSCQLETNSIFFENGLLEKKVSNESNEILYEKINEKESSILGELSNNEKNDLIDNDSQFPSENLDAIDYELDALLNDKPVSKIKTEEVEPMEVDPPVRESPENKVDTFGLSLQPPEQLPQLPSSSSQTVLSESDSSSDATFSPPSSPVLGLYTAMSVNDVDETSSREILLIPNSKLKRKRKKETITTDDVESGKRNKLERDQEISSSQKKVKLEDSDPSVVNLKKKSDLPLEHIIKKKIKNESTDVVPENESTDVVSENESTDVVPENESTDVVPENESTDVVSENQSTDALSENGSTDAVSESESTDVVPENQSTDALSENGSSDAVSEKDLVFVAESNSSLDETKIRNRPYSLEEINKLKEEMKKNIEKISPEEMKEVLEGRKKLFANYFEGKIDINLNRSVLEEMLMAQMVDFMAYRCEVGMLRQKCRLLQSEQTRSNQLTYDLKRQIENAKLIIKRLIDEKINNRNWTRGVIPLKVTRSVGLQVNISSTTTVRKVPERQSTRFDKTISRGNQIVTRSSLQNNNVAKNKVGSVENKENISANIEKDNVNKNTSNDDVMIVSVNESAGTSISKAPSSSAVSRNINVPEVPKNVPEVSKSVPKVPTKNGITLGEKPVRKPLNVDYAKSPQVSKKTSISQSNTKNSLMENSTKKAIPTSRTENIDEIIDLTDKEDQPTIKKEPSSKLSNQVKSSKNILMSDKAKTPNTQLANKPLLSAVGMKKPPVQSSTTKKSGDINAGDDLVNSYDHLPKYPMSPKYPANVIKPPRPTLRIGKNSSGKQGIMLSWSFEGGRNPPNIEEYQLYAFQESKSSEKVKTDTWKKVGDIKALPLPMACFLTQFVEGHKYHFIVRAVDTMKRLGDFSLPSSIILHAAEKTPSAS